MREIIFTNIELISTIISSALTFLLAVLAIFIYDFIRRFHKTRTPHETYAHKLTRLTDILKRSSSEVDQVLTELSQVAHNREKAARQLEIELRQLESREKDIQTRIHDLEKVPIPVAEHFAKLSAASERKSALRDYTLFGAGVLVSTIIAIILRFFGLG